jgi:hypothetical protein
LFDESFVSLMNICLRALAAHDFKITPDTSPEKLIVNRARSAPPPCCNYIGGARAGPGGIDPR